MRLLLILILALSVEQRLDEAYSRQSKADTFLANNSTNR